MRETGSVKANRHRPSRNPSYVGLLRHEHAPIAAQLARGPPPPLPSPAPSPPPAHRHRAARRHGRRAWFSPMAPKKRRRRHARAEAALAVAPPARRQPLDQRGAAAHRRRLDRLPSLQPHAAMVCWRVVNGNEAPATPTRPHFTSTGTPRSSGSAADSVESAAVAEANPSIRVRR